MIKLLTELDENMFNRLDEFVTNHPHGNFFQSPQAFNFYKSFTNIRPSYIIAHENDEIIACLLYILMKEPNSIKGYFSRRIISEGGPLIAEDDSFILSKIISELDKHIKDTIYVEFRNFTDPSKHKKVFNNHDYDFIEHLNYIVNIDSYEQVRANLSKSKKRQINKSIKNGAEIVEAKSVKEVITLYKILADLYKEKVKKPLPPIEFFTHFFDMENLGKYFLIKLNGEIIGGIMCPIYKQTIYEWYVCGEDDKYKDIYPSVLATWAPIEYAANNGLKYFDFLGAGKPDEDYGVREFKSKFGGQLVNYGRFRKINNKFLYRLGEIGIKILGKV